MSYIGIGSPIPDISNLPGQTGGEVEVTLDYPSSSACGDASPFLPSEATPAGGVFSASPAGLNLNTSTGEVTPVGSTPQTYTISYTVSGIISQFALTINVAQQSTFSYSSSSFQQIGTATPTLAGGTTLGGSFSAPVGVSINTSTGVIDLAASTIGGPYTITYTTPGPCASASTFTLSITAVSVELIPNNFAMEFDGINQNVNCGTIPSFDDGDISFSLWCKLTTTGAHQYILSSTNTGSVAGINIAMHPNTNLLFERSQDVANTQNSTGYSVPGFSFGSWHHLCGTYSAASGELKAYVNGVLKSTTTDIADARSASTSLKIGGLSNYPTLYASKGDIDEVAIWKRTLQLEDVQRIYNATNDNPGKCANLFTAGLGTDLVLWNRMGD